MIPVNPRPFTLRELVWMADGAQRERWSRTSSMMALIANVNRNPKKTRGFRPADFDPFAEKPGPQVLDRSTIVTLKAAMGRR